MRYIRHPSVQPAGRSQGAPYGSPWGTGPYALGSRVHPPLWVSSPPTSIPTRCRVIDDRSTSIAVIELGNGSAARDGATLACGCVV
jgi:hypothetical protein